jgi:hypothetical protein
MIAHWHTGLKLDGVAVEEVHVDEECEPELAEVEHSRDRTPDLSITTANIRSE